MNSGHDVRQIGGRATRVLEEGGGTPLLWLHDTFGNRWSEGHELLAKSHRVIAPSLPGFDDSTTLDGIDGPEDVVFWLVDLLDALGLDRPVVLGCGLGGWMAAELAVRYPDRLGGMVLVDAYGLKLDGNLPADEFALTRPMLRPLVFRDASGPAAQAWLPDVDAPDQVEPTLHARVAAARLCWQFPSSPKLRSWLSRARMPTLVVWGQHDRLVPPSHGEAYVEGLPQARLAILPDAAHYPYVEDPAAFANEVAAFIRGLEATSP
jgi:pimeloyl-ACP methyl ester carboxylesterase